MENICDVPDAPEVTLGREPTHINMKKPEVLLILGHRKNRSIKKRYRSAIKT